MKTTKIPVKIVEYTIDGETRKNVMIDMLDTYDIEGDPEEKIKNFKEKYFELVEDAKKIMPERRENKIPSVYWKIGDMFEKFNENMNSQFEITNYGEALERDFGLSYRYVEELIIFVKLFKENEIDDDTSMSIYRALVWKKSQLEEINELEKEKTRLMKRTKNKESIKREDYKNELTKLVESKMKQKVSKKVK